MITRSAIFEGRLKDGCDEEAFFAEIRDRLAPLWRRFPQASNVRLHRIASTDDDTTPILMIQQIDYPSLQAVEEALASPVRAQARAVTLELMENFEGRFYHLISEGNAVEPSA